MREQGLMNQNRWDGGAERRPRIRPPMTGGEWVALALLVAALLALMLPTALAWPTLPARIPTHFNLAGQVDSYGGKTSVVTLPLVGLALTLFLQSLARFPWAFNYPVAITPANAARNYRWGRLTLRWINALVVALFAFIQWQTIQTARGVANGLGIGPGPLIALILLIPVAAISLIVWWTRHA